MQSNKLYKALMDDVGEGRVSNIAKCLDEGANINLQYLNYSGNTPLHVAVIKKDLEIIKLLLKRGAIVNYKNNEGKTALDVAKQLDSDIGQAIVELLEAHGGKKGKTKTYKKRYTLYSIEGQLYETKLLTLIRMRSSINSYDEFYLGTNLEEIGVLNDVCVRYKQNNKDVIIFLEAKHRIYVEKSVITPNDLWEKTGGFSLFEYFKSYMKIRKNFNDASSVIFNGKYENIHSYFVIYTPAYNKLLYKRTTEFSSIDQSVRNLIESGKHSEVFRYQYSDEEVDLLTKSVLVEDMKCLGKNLYNYIKKNNLDMMLHDTYLLRYHVALARHVINVSDVNDEGYRTGTFCDEFFNNNDELLVVLRETIFKESIKKNNLSKARISYNFYKDADDIDIKKNLSSFCFKLPPMFGNLDIAIRKGKNGVKRLEYLAGKIEYMISKHEDKNIFINNELIKDDKLIGTGVLKLNGGLGSAVGNLLISSENDLLKFNMNCETLGENAKLLLSLLKDKIHDLESYRFRFDIESFPKLSFKADEQDRILAIDFFNNFWFYTNQAKQDEVEKISKEILKDYSNSQQQSASSVRDEAVYLKIHDEIQKWWMHNGESHYLSNNIEYFDTISKEISAQLLLVILSNSYVTLMESYDIQFKEDAVQFLSMQMKSNFTVIVTDVVTLIGIKLVQHFQKLNSYTFIDLDSPSLLSTSDRNDLKAEFKKEKFRTLIIIYKDESESKNELFHYLIKETLSKEIIIVTNTKYYQKFNSFVSHYDNFVKIKDDKIEMTDLVMESQKKILKNKFLFQGTETNFDNVIHKEAKKLIKPFIIQRVINNEIIKVGKPLLNSNDEDINDYYVDRRLVFDKSKEIIELKSLADINDTVVLTGAPGSGKSAYLTNISIATKQQNPSLWIEKINLLDYTKEFYKWQENNIKIDLIKALKFVCKTAVTKTILRKNVHYNFDEFIFNIDFFNNELVLRKCDVRNSVLFELEMFIYCYNKGNVILIFDGFDAICPKYKEQVTNLLKCLVTRSSRDKSDDKQRMWIASRSYNNIIKTLEGEFHNIYELVALSVSELQRFMTGFYKININFKKLNNNQIMRVGEFIEYTINQFDNLLHHADNKDSNFILSILYLMAFKYFQNELSNTQLTSTLHFLVTKWNSTIKDNSKYNEFLICEFHSQDEAINPRHMYMALDYFTNKILNTDTDTKWDLKSNKFSFFNYFLDAMAQLFLENYYRLDIYNVDVNLWYKKAFAEFLDEHKNLGFYATFTKQLNEILTRKEIFKIQRTIKKIVDGKEKTGLVDHVVEGVPKFIHVPFQEYFAAEYIVDLLNNKQDKDQLKLAELISKYDNVKEYLNNNFDFYKDLRKTLFKEMKINKFDNIFNNNTNLSLYEKLGGTSDQGKLYEVKLIILIIMRSIIKAYDELYLGTNLKGLKAFNDICVRYKHMNKDIFIFIQTKHEATTSKINARNLWNPKEDFNLFKYFENYKKIRKRFNQMKTDDIIFNGKYEDMKIYFVIHTLAGIELRAKKPLNDNNTMDKSVRKLIQSGRDILQFEYTDEEVNLLTKSVLVEQMKCLAKRLFHFIGKQKFNIMLSDSYVRRYHVVLAKHIINVSDVNDEGHRTGTFCNDFFNNNDELFVALKQSIFSEVIKEIQFDRNNLEELVQAVLLEPTMHTISKLMQTVSTCYNSKNNTLVFSNKTMKDLSKNLSKIRISYDVYKGARDIAIKEKLSSFCFKLPAMFGNFDIAIRKGKNRVKRLEYLAEQIEYMISKYEDKNIFVNNELIEADKLIGAGVLKLNGGLGSAVGNLLILSEGDMFKFDLNDENLGENAKKLLELLKCKIDDLDTYRFQFDIEEFPKLTLKANECDKTLAKDFFINLWFYTNQAKQDEIEEHSKEILEDRIAVRQETNSSLRYEAVYLKIHDEVRKYWLAEGQSYYITIGREFLDNIVKEFMENSLLKILSSVYIKQIKKYDIQFDEASIRSLCDRILSDYTVIITEVITLTAIKLVQHYQYQNNYAFLDLDTPLELSRSDRNAMKEEIRSNYLHTLIVICRGVNLSKSELFRYIIKKNKSAQLIIVTNKQYYATLNTYISHNHEFIKIIDNRIKLVNLISESQIKVLKNKFIYQGDKIPLHNVIQEDAKYLITPYMLLEILNNENIEVGETTSNQNYEEMKDYYVDRKLSIAIKSEELLSTNKSKQIVKLKTLEDINGTVVLTGAPGAGKSIFLTHMSIATKQQNPAIWIHRINLINYTKEFHRWQENKIKIDYIEALKFVCKSSVSKIRRSNINSIFDNIIFDLEIDNDELVISNFINQNDPICFELQLFIHCYNNENTILLFDGFDEICPHYKDVVIDLLKCLVNSTSNSVNSDKQRMWITSRSYNNIISTLESEFGEPKELVAITETELQTLFMKSFLKINLNLNELNYDQLLNIDGFFEYMKMIKTFGVNDIVFRCSSIFVYILYCTAAEYFQSVANTIQFDDERHILTMKWNTMAKFDFYDIFPKSTIDQKAIIPLHMYLIAIDNFVSEIKKNTFRNTDTDLIMKWNLNANSLLFHKHFLETKLKRIRFEHKNQMDLYNPDVKLTYEKEFKDFYDKHKKIAFYATFTEQLDELLTKVEIDEMLKIIKEFEAGEEKTGIVDYTVDGVPKFIQLMYQEYFTAQYIGDLLTTKPEEEQPELWKFILKNVTEGVMEHLDRKFEFENDFKNIYLSEETKQFIYDEVKANDCLLYNFISKETLVSSSFNINSKHITAFILRAMLENVNEDNFDEFVYILGPRTPIFTFMINNKWYDIIFIALDRVRQVDPSKLCEFDLHMTNKDFTVLTNEEILEEMESNSNL